MFKIIIKVPPGLMNASALLNAALASGTNRATIYLTNQAKTNVPVGKTGNLRRSIIMQGSGMAVKVIQDLTVAKYGSYVENGTGIYGPTGQPIKPVRAKALSWVSNGKRVFARSVKGMKPRYYMRNTFINGQAQVKEIFQTEIQKAIAKMGE